MSPLGLIATPPAGPGRAIAGPAVLVAVSIGTRLPVLVPAVEA